jgi:hypothetical protein
MALFCDCEKIFKDLEIIDSRITSELKFIERRISNLESSATGNFQCEGGVNGIYPTEPCLGDVDRVANCLMRATSGNGYIRINCPAAHINKFNRMNCYVELGKSDRSTYGEVGIFDRDEHKWYVFKDESVRGNVLEFKWISDKESIKPYYLEFTNW